jgi:PAS domain S-box-containing protein
MEEYGNQTERDFRLLVVEDDSTLLQLIEKKLPGDDLAIETAKDGASAIEVIRGNPPDLLLLDYLLSDMDGSRLVEYIRSKGLEIPFIIMTGFGDEKIAVNLMKLGAQDYIIKDPNFLALLPVVVNQVKDNIKTRQKLAVAQKALRESEYNYRILVESSRDLIFTTDLNGKFLFVNNNFENITGYSKDELFSKSFIDLIEQDFLEVAQEKFVSGLTGKEIPFFQVNFHSKSGKIIPLELNITSIVDSGSTRKGMLCICRDISHRRRYEETLKISEEYFRTLIQNSSDAIVLLNGDGTFRFISNAVEHIIGYQPHELESMKLFDIIHQKDIVRRWTFSGKWFRIPIRTALSKSGLPIKTAPRATSRVLAGI